MPFAYTIYFFQRFVCGVKELRIFYKVSLIYPLQSFFIKYMALMRAVLFVLRFSLQLAAIV